MNQIKHASFGRTDDAIEAIIAEISDISKPARKFIIAMYIQWWSIRGRYNFTNLSRYGGYCEKSLRKGFKRGFDFIEIGMVLIGRSCSKEKILAFDPSYIRKSGKHTQGLDWFWSGTAQTTKKGLEIGCLAVVDVKNETAMHMEAIQTPNSEQRKKQGVTMVKHYAGFILSRMVSLLTISKYLAVDGYFMKKEFILPIVKEGLHIITKMRNDANLRYLYKGRQSKGKGRKKMYDGKVNLNKIDKRKWDLVKTEKNKEYYTSELYCITLKKVVRIVYLYDIKSKKYEVFLCTDTKLSAMKIVRYYRLRYQIEFLLRDAKQHAGLEDCQARDEKKMHFHFNMALSSVSMTKALYYLSTAKEERKEFSMQDVKRLYHNKLITETIFSNLDLDLNCKKIKKLYHNCLDIGRMAA
jgi:hypothetical protein